MSWVYEQLFNALNDGDLNGQDSWVADSQFDVNSGAGNPYEGAKCVKFAGIGDVEAYRILDTAVDTGFFYFVMKTNTAPCTKNTCGFSPRKGAGLGVTYVRFGTNGYIQYYSGGWQNYFTYSANTYYVFAIEVDRANQADKFRIKYNDGSGWSAWSAWLNSVDGFTSIDRVSLIINLDSTADFYFDTITPTDPTAPPAAITRSHAYIF